MQPAGRAVATGIRRNPDLASKSFDLSVTTISKED